jgi:hypothetical protein
VATLIDRRLAAGRHAARWDGRCDRGRPAGAGVYLARLVMAGEARVATRKIQVLH